MIQIVSGKPPCPCFCAKWIWAEELTKHRTENCYLSHNQFWSICPNLCWKENISFWLIATASSFLQSIENLPTVFGSNPKAHIAAKTVFHLAHRHGDILREGWKNIMEAMLQLFRAELLPKAMVEVIISWLVDNWGVRGVGSWLFIEPVPKVGELSCKGLALVKCVQNLEACERYSVQVMCSFFCSLFLFFSFYFLLDLRNSSIYFTWTDFECCAEEGHACRHEVLEHSTGVTRWEWHFTDRIVGWRAGFDCTHLGCLV